MNLVDWFKGMVGNRLGEEVVDPLIEIPPSPRALKRVLLVCLRCIDLDANKRPKMGQIVHMLEADDFPYRSVSTVVNLCSFNYLTQRFSNRHPSSSSSVVLLPPDFQNFNKPNEDDA